MFSRKFIKVPDGPIVMTQVAGGMIEPPETARPAQATLADVPLVAAQDGINGRPVNYIVEDDAWNPEQAAQVAAKLSACSSLRTDWARSVAAWS